MLTLVKPEIFVVSRSVQKYEVGQRVFYKALFNNPGHYRPEDKLPGTIICAFLNGSLGWTYRVELDMTWNDRVAAHGQKIIVGNIRGGSLFPIKELFVVEE